MVIEVIFENGDSMAITYRYSSDVEAMQHAWQIGRLTRKPIRLVRIMTTLAGCRYPMIDAEIAQ